MGQHNLYDIPSMMDFFLTRFANSVALPDPWTYVNAFPDFSIRGYSVHTDRTDRGFTVLKNVQVSGFEFAVVELPGFKLTQPYIAATITTDALYTPNAEYHVVDLNKGTGTVTVRTIAADQSGRLKIHIDGNAHIFTINEPGEAAFMVAGIDYDDGASLDPNTSLPLELDILNGSRSPLDLVVTLTTSDTNITIVDGSENVAGLPASHVSTVTGIVVRRKYEGLGIPLTVTLSNGSKTVIQHFTVPYGVVNNTLSKTLISDGSQREQKVPNNALNYLPLSIGNRDQTVNPGELITVLGGPVLGEYDPIFLTCVNDNVVATLPFFGKEPTWIGEYMRGTKVLIKSDASGDIEMFGKHEVQDMNGSPTQSNPAYFHRTIHTGKVTLSVTGMDQTPPLPVRAKVRKAANDALVMVQILDGGTVSSTQATLHSGTGPAISLELSDDGNHGDLTAGDRVFSALWIAPISGVYRISVSATDEFGNSTVGIDMGTAHIIP